MVTISHNIFHIPSCDITSSSAAPPMTFSTPNSVPTLAITGAFSQHLTNRKLWSSFFYFFSDFFSLSSDFSSPIKIFSITFLYVGACGAWSYQPVQLYLRATPTQKDIFAKCYLLPLRLLCTFGHHFPKHGLILLQNNVAHLIIIALPTSPTALNWLR